MVNLVSSLLRERWDFSLKFWYLFACWFCALLFLMFQGGKLAYMIFIIVSLLGAYLALGRWSGIANASGSRNLPGLEKEGFIEAGSSVSVELRLHVPGVWPIPYVLLKDRLIRRNGRQAVIEHSIILDWKRNGNAQYITGPLRRGFYHFAETDCLTEDIFGLFQHKGELLLERSFSVLPRTIPIPNWKQVHHAPKGHLHHSTTTRSTRETTQINGIREYIYGDRISRIHWNATAKTGTWKSKEFERESLPKIMVMLDRNRKAYPDAEQFELAVSVAASLFQYGIKKELALGLLSAGESHVYFDPKRHELQQKQILHHLVEVEADGNYELLDVLKDRERVFSHGTLFVVVSPRKDEQALFWIQQRRMNPCHIWIAPKRDAGGPDWLAKLASRGVPGYAVQSLHELPAVLGGRNS